MITVLEGVKCRCCSACEGALAYPFEYTGEGGQRWVSWMCSSSGCMVGDDVPVIPDPSPPLDKPQDEG